MEDGRRLENLSWRLWNRETFCCESQPQSTPTRVTEYDQARPGSSDVPELSASVDSIASDDAEQAGVLHPPHVLPFDIVHHLSSRISSMESSTSSRGREKHITSLGLEKMVMSIKEKKMIEPLSASIMDAVPKSPHETTTPLPASPQRKSSRQDSDSSTSTGPLSDGSSPTDTARADGSDTSAELLTSHSVVRGFSLDNISSFRSRNHLAPTPVPTKSQVHPSNEDTKKKKGMGFMLGGSSGEDDSSFEDKMSTQQSHKSSLTSSLKRSSPDKKQTSFQDEVESRTITNRSHEDEDVFEDSDDDEDVSGSAIEDEEDSSDWEDSASESGASSMNEKQLFQRVDSRPHLPSRRSLLTTLIHQPDRAAALAEMALKASKSTSALRRSKTSSPNGPSVASSPEDDSFLDTQEENVPGARPIIMTTSNIHPPALSPRTTRRNMLATEMTESLRKHLLWERQQKNTTANAVLKRRHTAHDMANLQQFPTTAGSGTASKNNSWNHYFDHGLGEYHQKGW